jgi:hypothetical protein
MDDSLTDHGDALAALCSRIDRLIEAHDWTNMLLLDLVNRLSIDAYPREPVPASRAPHHVDVSDGAVHHDRALGNLIFPTPTD